MSQDLGKFYLASAASGVFLEPLFNKLGLSLAHCFSAQGLRNIEEGYT